MAWNDTDSPEQQTWTDPLPTGSLVPTLWARDFWRNGFWAPNFWISEGGLVEWNDVSAADATWTDV